MKKIMLRSLALLALGTSLVSSRSVDHEWPRDTFIQPLAGESGEVSNPQLDFPATMRSLLPTRQVPSNNTKTDRNETTLPLPGIPFPKQDWHGARRPNYTNLYLNYTEPVYCIRTWKPIGFYGFATWLVSIIVLTQDLLDSLHLEQVGLTKIVSSFANIIFFVISLARASKAYTACARRVQEAGGSYVVDGQVVTHTSDAFGFLFLACPIILDGANLFVQFSYVVFGACMSHWLVAFVMLLAKGLALLATLFVPILFYTGYTNFLYADDTMRGPIACVAVMLTVVSIGLVVYITFKYGRFFWHVVFGSFAVCIVPLILVHICLVGISYILVGRTIDDDWGTTSCSGPLGTVQAVLDGVVPLISTITSIMLGEQ